VTGPIDRHDLRMARVSVNYLISALTLVRKPVPPAARRLADHLDQALTACGQEPVAPQPQWVTTAEVAELLGCSPRTARRIAARVGYRAGRDWLIPIDAIEGTDE